jgi:hypothetical protein
MMMASEVQKMYILFPQDEEFCLLVIQKMYILFPQVEEFCLLMSKHTGVFNFEGDE